MIQNGFTRKGFGAGRRWNKATPLARKLNYAYHTDTMKLWQGKVTGLVSKLSMLGNDFQEVELGHNKVLVGGLECLAEWLYGIKFKVEVSTFEDDLYNGAKEDLRPHLKQTGDTRIINSFNVCYDGSIGADEDPYPRYKIGYTKDTLIPFRRIRESVNSYDLMMNTYAHPVKYEHPDGTIYIDYYSKKVRLDYNVTMDDGTPVPNNPNENYEEDKDCRLIANFGLTITEDEFVEYFRTEKAGGAESAAFNATLVMAGYPAELTIGSKKYQSQIGSYVFARCNHKMIAHGVDGYSNLQYKIMHI